MTNPQTLDRRDVAHPTSPIGGQGHIEQIRKPDRAKALDLESAGSRADREGEANPRKPRASV